MPKLRGGKQSIIFDRGTNPYPKSNYPSSNQRFFYTQKSCTFVVPPGVKLLKTLRVWGAGGSGGAGDNSTFGGGGAGSGAYEEKVNIAVTPGTQITITVGLGGAPTVSFSSAGTAGGTSSAVVNAVTYQCTGGGAGNNLTAGSGGTANGSGSTNTNGSTGSSSSGGNGGAGGNAPGTMPGIAGITGKAGPTQASTSSNGNDGTAPGAGGSGAGKLSAVSGRGADGAVYIAW